MRGRPFCCSGPSAWGQGNPVLRGTLRLVEEQLDLASGSDAATIVDELAVAEPEGSVLGEDHGEGALVPHLALVGIRRAIDESSVGCRAGLREDADRHLTLRVLEELQKDADLAGISTEIAAVAHQVVAAPIGAFLGRRCRGCRRNVRLGICRPRKTQGDSKDQKGSSDDTHEVFSFATEWGIEKPRLTCNVTRIFH